MTTEESLRALEDSLGIRLTVVDRDGIFHTPAGRALLSLDRQSHRKNEVCRIGFCQRCIDHCRYEMTREGEKRKAPFVHTCWKGLSEVVIPLIRRGQHFGSLFAGIWRTGKKSQAEGELPPEFAAIYSSLSPLSGERALALEGILSLLARGLLDRLDEEAVLVFPEESRQREIGRAGFKSAILAGLKGATWY